MIDIQTLHIGSHVLFNGERIEVSTLDALNGFIGMKEHCGVDADGMKFAIANTPDKFDPIPITYELLKDIMTENGEIEQVGNIISSETTHGQHKISIVITGEVIGVMVNRLDDCYSFVAQCMNIKFLHELQTFVYLTTKQRLI